MSTFLELKTRIADELNRSDLTSQIALAITSAIDHYKYKRFWFNEGTTTSTTTASQEYQPLPSSPTVILSIDSIHVTDGSQVRKMDEKDFKTIDLWQSETTPQTDVPYWFAQYKDRVRLFPIPDATYTLTWAGIIQLAALSGDADTNGWTTEAEQLIRQRAKSIVRCDVIEHPRAIQEANMMALRGETFLSPMEKAAFNAIAKQTVKRTTPLRISAGC
jgi:hypothetical protein